MQDAGSALMGIGSARGDDRALQAAELAVSSPLLEASIDGAYGVLLSIQGGSDLGLYEVSEAARLVQEAAHPDANIIFGSVIDDALGDEVRVTVIAGGAERRPAAAGAAGAASRPGRRRGGRSWCLGDAAAGLLPLAQQRRGARDRDPGPRGQRGGPGTGADAGRSAAVTACARAGAG